MRKGYYTGKLVSTPEIKKARIGKISGWLGTGEPVYDLLDRQTGKKIGELNNNFIKKYRNKERAALRKMWK